MPLNPNTRDATQEDPERFQPGHGRVYAELHWRFWQREGRTESAIHTNPMARRLRVPHAVTDAQQKRIGPTKKLRNANAELRLPHITF